jgi:hypothetical protein
MKSSLLPVVLMIAFVSGTCRAQQFPRWMRKQNRWIEEPSRSPRKGV